MKSRSAMKQLSERMSKRRQHDDDDDKPVRKSKSDKKSKKKFETIEVNFALEEKTKRGGAYRYKECDDDGEFKERGDDIVCGTLYLRVDALDGAKAPKQLKVTIEIAD